jgi:hypothetical protein
MLPVRRRLITKKKPSVLARCNGNILLDLSDVMRRSEARRAVFRCHWTARLGRNEMAGPAASPLKEPLKSQRSEGSLVLDVGRIGRA